MKRADTSISPGITLIVIKLELGSSRLLLRFTRHKLHTNTADERPCATDKAPTAQLAPKITTFLFQSHTRKTHTFTSGHTSTDILTKNSATPSGYSEVTELCLEATGADAAFSSLKPSPGIQASLGLFIIVL